MELNKPASGADDSDHLMDFVTDTDTEGKDHTRDQDAGFNGFSYTTNC